MKPTTSSWIMARAYQPGEYQRLVAEWDAHVEELADLIMQVDPELQPVIVQIFAVIALSQQEEK